MTFEENPFRVLRVSIYDTKTTINERTDELSFEDPDREEIFEQARTILLNPKKRIAAEVQWLVSKELFFSGNIFPWLATVDKNFSAQKPAELRKKINMARSESKFPAVEDVADIKTELKNIRYEIRKMIQDEFHANNQRACVNFANRFVEEVLNEKSFGVIVEDFFDSYCLEMTPFLEETEKQITILLSKIKVNPQEKFVQELRNKLKNFSDAIRPLDKMSTAVGSSNFDQTENVFYEVRDTAIKLFNEKNFINAPLIITRMLEQNFSYLPSLTEVIREDIKFLEEAKARRPTQSFLDAKATLDKIQKSMDNRLHCSKGFEHDNLKFYNEVFKPSCSVLITGLMLPDKHSRKPNEWKALTAKAAVIYLHMGTALTWTNRADFALECFQKALPYAKASGDPELISLARKRIEEWENIKTLTDSRKDSSGCFWYIVIAVVILWLMS